MELLIFGAIGLLLLAFLGSVIILIGRLAAKIIGFATGGRSDRAKWEARARYVTYAGLLLSLAYSIYGAMYPSDDFFLAEFKEVTLREPPFSSKIVAKSASYPDLHGDYCSYSRIELTPTDYSALLGEIEADSCFEPSEEVGSDEQQEALKAVPVIPTEKSFTRPKPGKPDHHLTVKFLSGGKHVEVSLCVT